MVLTVAKLSVGSVLKEGDTLLTLAPMSAPLEAEVQVLQPGCRLRSAGRSGDDEDRRVQFCRTRDGRGKGQVDQRGRVHDGRQRRGDAGLLPRARFPIVAIKLIDVPSTFRLIPGMTLVADVKVGTRALGAYLIGGMIHGVGEAMREP